MNKTSACIKLIQILYAQDDYINTKTLAEFLDTNPRNIREYFKEIESLGYIIDSSKGLYGGYRLIKDNLLPSLNLTDEENEILYKALNELRNQEFEDTDKLNNIIGKFLASNNQKIVPLRMIDRYPSNMEFNDLKIRYDLLIDAIKDQYKVKINYLNFNNKIASHIIHPYIVFIYNGAYFTLAYNEIKDDMAFYKLDRIDEIEVIKNRFSKDMDFVLEDYLDEFGIKKDEEYIHVEIELTNLNKVIANHIYGKNQEIVNVSVNKSILKCDMQNKGSIIAFVMSFGPSAKVLSPEWLKEEVKDNLFKALERYDEND